VTSSSAADQDFTGDAASIEAKLDQIRSHVRAPLASCPALTLVDAYLLIKNVDADVKSHAVQEAQLCICGPSADPTCINSRATTLAAPGLALSTAETIWNQAEVQSTTAVVALGDAVRHLAGVNGTRIMVLISSGFLPPLSGQKNSTMDPIVNAALRWNIVIHSLDAKSLDADREGVNGNGFQNTRIDRTRLSRQTALWEPLEKLSKGTGGHFFHNTNDLAGALQMATEPAISYQVSFNPGSRDGQFHNLKIAFKNKTFYSLQFRPGYFSPEELKKEALNRAALDAAVFSKQNLRELPAGVSLSAGQLSAGTIPLSVEVTVDVNHLQFATDAGRHVQQIVFLTTLLDPGNSFVTGKESIMDLSLTDEKLAALKKDGLKAVATLNVPAGIYHVRTIVREAMKGNLAASTIPIDLRNN
jgi:VWFA-related protein